MAKKWIQSAIKRPGALTRKAKAKGMTVSQFINQPKSTLARLSPLTRRQVALAKTLRKF